VYYGYVCTYDNPATMARECWQDGKLLCSYSAKLFLLRPLPGDHPIPSGFFFFGANIGPWETGQLWGDAAAIDDEAMISHRLISDLAASQEALPADMREILQNNAWDLYEN